MIDNVSASPGHPLQVDQLIYQLAVVEQLRVPAHHYGQQL
jgi:hypothetical protein